MRAYQPDPAAAAALVAGGLDLTGLDISAAAIAQLAARIPDRRDLLIHGDLSSLPDASRPAACSVCGSTPPPPMFGPGTK